MDILSYRNLIIKKKLINLTLIKLRGNNVIISNIEISDCNDGPVVRIASKEIEGTDFNNVELLNLDFVSNVENEEGGALYIGAGNSVNINNSTFRNNSAQQVIYNLKLRNT